MKQYLSLFSQNTPEFNPNTPLAGGAISRRQIPLLPLISLVFLVTARPAVSLDAAKTDAARERLEEVVGQLADAGEFSAKITIFGRESDVRVESADEDGVAVDYDGEVMDIEWDDIDNRALIAMLIPKLDATTAPVVWADIYLLMRASGDYSGAAQFAFKASQTAPAIDKAVKACRKNVFGDDPGAVVAMLGEAAAATQTVEVKKPQGVMGDPYPDTQLKRLPVAHPRLFVRADSEPSVPGVPSVSELRKRGKTNPWSYFKNQSYGVEGALNYALWYLMYDDKKALAKAWNKVTRYKVNGTTSDGLNARDLACIYDWCYDGLTEEQRATLVQLMHRRVTYLKKAFLENAGAHIFHTRMNSPPYGILCIGIALKGDDPKADEYIDYAKKYLLEKVFPGRKYLGGALQNGMTYGAEYIFSSVAEAAMAWYAFSGENWFYRIAYKDGNWMEAQLMFAMNNWLPNGHLAPYGDFAGGTLSTDHGAYISFLMPMICGTRFPEAMAFTRYLHKKNGRGSVEHPETWRMFLFWDDSIPSKDWRALRKETMFGKDSIGMWFGRTGWGDDDVVASFRCGGNYGNHQHHDSGHFFIFRKEPLAMDSGSYTSGFGSPSRKNYYWRSVAHNVFMFDKPGDTSDDGGERIVTVQGLSSMAEVLSNNTIKTGAILNYVSTDKYIYICGDVKPAYPAYCAKFIRHFVFLVKTGTVVIMDEVGVSARDRRMAFLLHAQNELKQESANRWSTTFGGSKLTVQTLAPGKVDYATVGGPGKEGWNMGRNYPQKKALGYPHGNWRLEISPPLGTTSCVMINVLQATDASVTPPAATLRGYTINTDGVSITFAPGSSTVSVK